MKKDIKEIARLMVLIRVVEEEIGIRYGEQKMRCPVHLCIGQEASAAAICGSLEDKDIVFSNHRAHGHYIAKGGNIRRLIAELYGKESGCCGGKGGSMHLTDIESGFMASTPIVASTVPIATGAAMAIKKRGHENISVSFFGDGAMECGVIQESMNYAATNNLPVVYCCENNFYSVYTHKKVRVPADRDYCKMAEALGLKTIRVDGNSLVDIVDMINMVRTDTITHGRPWFVELETYRLIEHCGPQRDEHLGYRSEDEVRLWEGRDPIRRYEEEYGEIYSKDEIKKLRGRIDEIFDDVETETMVVAHYEGNNACIRTGDICKQEIDNCKKSKTYAECIREGLKQILSIYSESYIIGLGVPDPKGIFGTTEGLVEQFGNERILDMPLSEHAMTGIAIGSSIMGMRPILTHQRLDFSLVSIDQIVNQAAKWNYMFNGQMRINMIIRMIVGRGWGQGPQHSQSLHAWFAHVPGLRVVVPSTPEDAQGMMLSLVNIGEPAIIIEHRWLHGLRQEVPSKPVAVDVRKSRVIVKGKHITLIGVSYMTAECLKAAELLKEYNIEAEVIDLRVVSPLDKQTMVESARKTGLVLVADTGHKEFSTSAEISATITEGAMTNLRKPVYRACIPDYPTPTSSSLSSEYYLEAEDIAYIACHVLLEEYETADLFKGMRREKRDVPRYGGIIGPF